MAQYMLMQDSRQPGSQSATGCVPSAIQKSVGTISCDTAHNLLYRLG